MFENVRLILVNAEMPGENVVVTIVFSRDMKNFSNIELVSEAYFNQGSCADPNLENSAYSDRFSGSFR